MTKQLQDFCFGYDPFFSWLSYVADPVKYFFWSYPVAFTLDNSLGVRVLLATCFSEFINVTVKWLLNEHRPFWYVKAHRELGIELYQTPQTCETGPGCPSGHVMITAVVLYVMVARVTSCSDKRGRRENHWLGYVAWTTYFVYLVLVGASRVFIAAHFPHQILLGLLVGVGTGYLVTNISVDSWRMREYVLFSGVTAVICFAVYFGLQAFGTDPEASAKLALGACFDPKYVSVNTTPFYSVMRDFACPLGLGYALSRPNSDKVREAAARAPVWVKLVGGFAGIAVGWVILSLPRPASQGLVYAVAVAQFSLFSFAVAYGVQYVIYRTYGGINGALTPPRKKSGSVGY